MKELIERLRYPVLCTLDDRLEAADALERLNREKHEAQDCFDAAKEEIERLTSENAKMRAELASSRVGFTKVSPYEPGSRGRFSI